MILTVGQVQLIVLYGQTLVLEEQLTQTVQDHPLLLVRVQDLPLEGDFLWFPQGSMVPRVFRTIQMLVPWGNYILRI